MRFLTASLLLSVAASAAVIQGRNREFGPCAPGHDLEARNRGFGPGAPDHNPCADLEARNREFGPGAPGKDCDGYSVTNDYYALWKWMVWLQERV